MPYQGRAALSGRGMAVDFGPEDVGREDVGPMQASRLYGDDVFLLLTNDNAHLLRRAEQWG